MVRSEEDQQHTPGMFDDEPEAREPGGEAPADAFLIAPRREKERAATAYDRFVHAAESLASSLRAAESLASSLRQQEEEFARLSRITEQINYGIMLEEVLNFLYEEMKDTIPYNRIGFSLIDHDEGFVVAEWAKSDRSMQLNRGYRAPLAGSTLLGVIETGRPRIINDLEAYFVSHPRSTSTSLILREGIRSSLTCPLFIRSKPIGFVFFSSVRKNTYSDVHVEFFEQIAAQLAIIVEKGRLYSELAEQKATIEKQNAVMLQEMEMARRVQRALVPEKAPPTLGLEIALRYEPAIQVGGDVLDIVPLPNGKVLLFIADVMGHGVSAALVMSMVKTALHAAVALDFRPKEVLESMNKTIVDMSLDNFVTAACCVIDPATGLAALSLAGHSAPLWFQSQAGIMVEPRCKGLAIGIDGNARFETTEIRLKPGDVLALFTDGIVEAFDRQRAQYGKQRLAEQLTRWGGLCAQEICDAVRQDLDAHHKSTPLEDDWALLVAKLS